MDRLNSQDLMMLLPEELGWSQDIGALAILDGRPLLDADGRFRIETAREQIGRRLHGHDAQVRAAIGVFIASLAQPGGRPR